MNRHSPKIPRNKPESDLLGYLLIIVFGCTIAAMLAYSI